MIRLLTIVTLILFVIVSFTGCGMIKTAKDWQQKYEHAMQTINKLKKEKKDLEKKVDFLKKELEKSDPKAMREEYVDNFKTMLLTN